MNEHERRVSEAAGWYWLATSGREVAPPGSVELDTDGWEESARRALRDAVIMAEANGVRCV